MLRAWRAVDPSQATRAGVVLVYAALDQARAEGYPPSLAGEVVALLERIDVAARRRAAGMRERIWRESFVLVNREVQTTATQARPALAANRLANDEPFIQFLGASPRVVADRLRALLPSPQLAPALANDPGAAARYNPRR